MTLSQTFLISHLLHNHTPSQTQLLSRRERIVHPTRVITSSLKLLILPPKVRLTSKCRAKRQSCKHNLQNHRHGISRAIRIREEIRTHHVPQVPTNVYDGATRSALLGRLRQRAYSPCIHERISGETTRGVEKGSGVPGCGVECGDGDDEADDGNAVIGHDVETTFFLAIRVPRDEERHGSAEDVGGCSEEKSDGVGAETEASHHGGEEVVEAVGGGHENVHEDLIGCQLGSGSVKGKDVRRCMSSHL